MLLDQSAVIFLDHQDNIIDLSKTQAPDRVRHAAGVLASIAAHYTLPAFGSVVAFGVPDPKVTSSVSSVLPSLASAVRPGASAFADASSREAVQALNRPHLVLAGVLSEIVVAHTALDALAAGYSVTVLVEPTGGMDPRTEAAAFQGLRDAGASVEPLATWASRVVDSWHTDDGVKMGQWIASLLG